MAEKLPKKWILQGLKLRGLLQNQISTPYFTYVNDQYYKTSIQGDFESELPTHIGAIHAISKIE